MAYPSFMKAIEKNPKYMLPYVGFQNYMKPKAICRKQKGILRKALSAEPENVVILSELGYFL
jgi:hypothetical protein